MLTKEEIEEIELNEKKRREKERLEQAVKLRETEEANENTGTKSSYVSEALTSFLRLAVKSNLISSADSRHLTAKTFSSLISLSLFIMPLPLIGGGIKRCFCLTSLCLTSVCRVQQQCRTERPRKTKIGTQVVHITCDSDTTFKVKGQGHQATLVGCSSHYMIYMDDSFYATAQSEPLPVDHEYLWRKARWAPQA